jgi:WD40 repeat protein
MFFLASGATLAQDGLPDQEPFLRIETGMHTAPIRRIGVDARCSMIATESSDKTLRLWDVTRGETGIIRLARTLRVPIGAGDDGRIYAVAVSPDGKWLAAGGFDAQFRTTQFHQIYIFNANTGQLAKRVGQLKDRTYHLVFSPDGRFLAATLKGGEGLRVWETAKWQQVLEDHEYGGTESHGAAFAADGKLYTTAFDGFIRRYGGRRMALEAKMPTKGSKHPYSIAVHRNGIAVGFDDRPIAEIYDMKQMRLLFVADTTGIDKGNLKSIAWSADGSRLLAGGDYNVDGGYPVFIWDRAGRGLRRQVGMSRDTVSQLVTCGQNIAVSAADPSFGLISPEGARFVWKEGPQPDMRGKLGDSFTVSVDGQRVRFGLGFGASQPIVFDLATMTLRDAAIPADDLFAARTDGLAVTDWQDNVAPKLSGRPIPLESNEPSRALAVAPDAQSFVLGAERYIRAFAADGSQSWKIPGPNTNWGVNVTRDGKLVIAVFADGTVRWYRLSDGRELLALFVQAKDRRWIAWTPMGYYAASAGGESLIGWHINRSWDDAADFFPAYRFRSRFYRPDVVSQVLAALDEDKAIVDADSSAGGIAPQVWLSVRDLQPPVLEIRSPRSGASFTGSSVAIEFTARPPKGEHITEVEVQIDGEKIKSRGLTPVRDEKDVMRMELPLPPRDLTVTLIARSGEKLSEPKSVFLTYSGPRQAIRKQPRLLALLVGVSAYQRPSLNLSFAHLDAERLAEALKDQQQVFEKVETRVLVNATRTAVMSGLKWLEDTTQEGDVSVVLLSGHGVTNRTGRFFFLPADGDPTDLNSTAISSNEFMGVIGKLLGGKIVFIDACRAGVSLDVPGIGRVPVDMNRLANDVALPENGALFFGSSSANQLSYEFQELKNGAFTAALLEGLAGKADLHHDGVIDTAELYAWLRIRVPELSKGLQTPIRHQSAPVEYTLAVIH